MQANGNFSIRRQLLFACAAIALVGLVAASDALHSRTEEILAVCEAIIAESPRLGMLLFVLLATASAMLAFFSSALFVPVGIYAWGMATCFLLLWAGWFLGGIFSFAVGRYVGRIVVARIVGHERLENLETRASKSTNFIHIVLFQAMLPSEIPGYVLGSLRYRFVPFALALALALVELPYALGTIYIGESFLQKRGWLLIAIAAAGALLLIVAYSVFRGRLRMRPAMGAD